MRNASALLLAMVVFACGGDEREKDAGAGGSSEVEAGAWYVGDDGICRSDAALPVGFCPAVYEQSLEAERPASGAACAGDCGRWLAYIIYGTPTIGCAYDPASRELVGVTVVDDIAEGHCERHYERVWGDGPLPNSCTFDRLDDARFCPEEAQSGCDEATEPICYVTCGGDWMHEAVCEGAVWTCPKVRVSGVEELVQSFPRSACPDDTCWGLPTRAERCDEGRWICAPEREDWAACPATLCATCEGFDPEDAEQEGCSCSCIDDHVICERTEQL